MRHMRRKAIVITTICATSVALSAQNPTIRIRAAKVVDGTGKTLANATIVVQGSKIVGIETSGSGTADYNLGRLTVVPGMIDVHTHVGWHFGPDGRYQPRGATPAQE